MIIVISITLFFMVLRFTVTVFNFISNPKLTRVSRAYTELVSIIIPVRNEEDNIVPLLASIMAQDYKNYEVLVYDDDSTDNTYNVCATFISGYSNYKIIKGKKLPNGWTGKNHACHQAAKKANGKYYLFIDAGETINKNLVNSAVHRMQLYKLKLLSLFANQLMPTFAEKTTLPLLHYMLLNLLPLRLIYLTKTTAFATASGKFMFFDAATYQKHQWHEQVADKVVEDVEIMKLLKLEQYKGEMLMANGMLSCRMYKTYGEALNGFSKNFLAAFNYSIPAIIIYILLLISGPMIILTTLNLNLIFFMIGLIMLTRIMIALAAGQKVWYNTLLHPIQMVNLVIIAFLSVQKHLTKTNVWKGRRV